MAFRVKGGQQLASEALDTEGHAHSPIEVPANSAKSADETQVSLTTMVQVQAAWFGLAGSSAS